MNETDQQTLLKRGRLQLAALAKQAAAARAEAERAELEILLTEAEAGAPQRLESWLNSHGNLASGEGIAERFARVDVGVPSGSDVRTAMVNPAASPRPSEQPAGDWSAYRQHALRRLPDYLQQPAANSRVAKSPATVQSEAKASADKDSRAGAKRVPDLVRQLDVTEPQPQPQPQPLSRWARLRSARGLTASAVIHLLLLLALAFVTLKLPEDTASLAIESSAVDSPAEPLELIAPVEAQPLEDTSEPLELTEPTLDAADTLSDVQASLSDALDSVAPAESSTFGPGAAALAASASAVAAGMSQASFYGAAASGNNFCFVIDGSGSMRNGPWDAAKLELLKSLTSLQPNQRFYIIFYNRELSAIPLPGEREPAPRALYATLENVQHARRWIDTLKIDIGAPPNDALELAISKEPDAIYLLTDGVTSVDVAQYLRQENRVEDLIGGEQIMVPIHTIAFYSLDGQQLLQQIATENRGQFIYVPDPKKR